MLISTILATAMLQPAAPATRPALTPYEQMARAAAFAATQNLPRDDDPDRVRHMAASDRGEARYFNRAGATRQSYESEWTDCRQIARRLAAARSDARMRQAEDDDNFLGGPVTTALDRGSSDKHLRRDIRRECLLARGWQMVEPDEPGRHRLSALSGNARDLILDRLLGADQVEPGARVTRWDNIAGSRGDADMGDGD
jgi:hypothetical protein